MGASLTKQEWIILERTLPGIRNFYDHVDPTPKTHLDLIRMFLDELGHSDTTDKNLPHE